MRHAALAAACLAACATTAHAAHHQPPDANVQYSITETLISEWLWDNGNGLGESQQADDYYWDVKSRLNIGMSSPGLDAGLRVDTTTFRWFMPGWLGEGEEADRARRQASWYARHGRLPEADGSYPHVGDYRLERAWALVDVARDWRLRAGDFPAQFGRGIALSLRKIDELGVDNALRGARIDGRLADRVDVTALAGLVNVANVNERFNLIAEDPLDLVSGGRVSVDLWGGNRAAVHCVHVDGRAEEVERGALACGGGIEFFDLPFGISVHAEANALRRTFVAAPDSHGFAAYADVSAGLGPVRLRAEYKRYDDFVLSSTGQDATRTRWELNHLPFADSADQLLESPTSVQGGHLRADWQVADDVGVFAAVAAADGLESENDMDAVHGYGGVEFYWDDRRSVVRLSGGYRHTWQSIPDVADHDDYRVIGYAKLESTVRLMGPLSLSLGVLHEHFTQWDLGVPAEFDRGTTSLGVDWAGIGGAYAMFEYDTQNRAPGVDNYFASGGLHWTQLDWLSVRARVGSQRGGRKCVSGVCREFPPFDGVRIELVVRL